MKKVVSFVLVLSVLLGLIIFAPVSSFAEDEPETYYWSVVKCATGTDLEIAEQYPKLIISHDPYASYAAVAHEEYLSGGEFLSTLYAEKRDNIPWKNAFTGAITGIDSGVRSAEIRAGINGEKVKPTSTKRWFDCANADKYPTQSSFALKTISFDGIDTSKVTDMSVMFQCCDGVESLDLTGFDTSSCTDMSYMFNIMALLKEVDGLETFDTSKVTTMNHMFADNGLEEIDVSHFDVPCVTSFYQMFKTYSSDGGSPIKKLIISNKFAMFDGSPSFQAFGGVHLLDTVVVKDFDTGHTIVEYHILTGDNTQTTGSINICALSGTIDLTSLAGFSTYNDNGTVQTEIKLATSTDIVCVNTNTSITIPVENVEKITAGGVVITLSPGSVVIEDGKVKVPEGSSYVGTDGYTYTLKKAAGEDAPMIKSDGSFYAEIESNAPVVYYYDDDYYEPPKKKEPVISEFCTDVTEENFGHDAVLWGYKNGYCKGKTETTFCPKDEISKAEFITLLWRLNGCPEVEYNELTDIEPNRYYTNAAKWAVKNNLISAENGLFTPTHLMKRSELVLTLAKCAKVSEKAYTGTFTDVPSDADYAYAVDWAKQKGITKGVGDNRFGPDQTCDRESLLTFIWRMYK